MFFCSLFFSSRFHFCTLSNIKTGMFRRSRFFFAAAFDPFATLGVVPATATRESVKQRYRELAMKYHPDSGTSADADKMEAINRAYNMLVKEGMVDQVRASSTGGGSSGTNDAGDGSNVEFDEQFEEDPEVVAKLDPGTERISEDGSHFLYLNRETNVWVRRRRPLTKPRQPRYSTFASHKQDPVDHVDLHDDIRRRSLSLQVTEENRTKHQKFIRHFREMIPFDHPVFVFIAMLVYIYTFYLLWHRIMDKKYLFDDKREFYFDKRTQRQMIAEAFETFEPESLLAADAAMLVFAAAALKTRPDDPVVPPTPSEATAKVPYYYYHLMLNCA